MRSALALMRTTSVVLSALLLSACQPETIPPENVKFSAPQQILQVRAVDRSQLRPRVQLSNNIIIPMQRTGDDSWTGTINVLPNSTYFVYVEWIETLPAGDLVLAQWTQNVAVDANGTQINLNTADYDYSADIDNDTITNLQERQQGSDPFVQNRPNEEDNNGNTNSDDQENSDLDTNEPNNEDDTNSDNGQSDDADVDDDDSDNEEPVTVINVDTNTTEPTVLIPRISPNQAPNIDGFGAELDNLGNLNGEWANAVQFDNSGARLWINNLMIDHHADAEDGEMLHRWAAMHDGTYLYLLVLSDDVGRRHSDSELIWQDDALNLFIDGNNSKLLEWGDKNDFHIFIALQDENSTNANHEFGGRSAAGPGSSQEALNIVFSTGPGKGPDGIRKRNWEQDVYELAIPLASADITVGQAFGLELQLDDDDDGDERDSRWGWYHPSRIDNTDTDQTYLNPSVMGTVVLEQ